MRQIGGRTVPRFFVETEPQGEVLVGGEAGRHMVRSLRMRPGEAVTLCAGTGKDFFCTVLETGPQGARVRVDRTADSVTEPRVQITVCPAWPKGDKLETVVQKSVELGAAEILPVVSRRCVARPDPAALEKKTQRLQRIALEAAQQSQRGKIPRVLPAVELQTALERAAREGRGLFFYEHGTGSLQKALETAGDRLFLFIGPEGGFDPEEARMAEELGAALLTLGPRILRAETAPLAALAAVLYARGEFEGRGEPAD